MTYVVDDWEICLYCPGTDSHSALNMMMVVFIHRYPINDLYPSPYTTTIGAFCIPEQSLDLMLYTIISMQVLQLGVSTGAV